MHYELFKDILIVPYLLAVLSYYSRALISGKPTNIAQEEVHAITTLALFPQSQSATLHVAVFPKRLERTNERTNEQTIALPIETKRNKRTSDRLFPPSASQTDAGADLDADADQTPTPTPSAPTILRLSQLSLGT